MKQYFKHFYVLLASLLLIFAFCMPVQAAEEKEPTIIPLAQGQVRSGSFSDKESAEVYYSITITQKQAITIYGTQTKGEYVSLSLCKSNMSSVDHQSTVSREATYKWRTKVLEPGNYYICVSSHFSAVDYTITYDPSAYPNAIPLERTKQISGTLTSEHDEDTYKIVLPESLSIIFDVTKTKGPYLSLDLYDESGAYVTHMSTVTEAAEFDWAPDEKLSAGTYYITASRHTTDVNYTISWQVKGPDSVENLRASKTTTNTITLKWKKSAGASKYIVYMNPAKKKGYKKYRTVTSNTCKVTKLSTATKYKFKIVPTTMYGAETILGDEEIVEIATAPKKVATPTVKFRSSSTISGVPVNYYTVKWKKVKGASGYEVYLKGKGTNGWKNSGSTKSTSTTIYIVKGYSGQIKIRAYTASDEHYSYGAFSKVKTIKSK